MTFTFPMFVVAMLVGMIGAVAVRAADVPAQHPAKVELLADVASIQPGKPFTVGVRLTMQPHWHTYWINPGESGQPIAVKWNLPAGFTAGELKFPVPTRFVQPGDLYGYGYEDEVLLTTVITPPAQAGDALSAELTANVSWLVCKEICIPGKATVSLGLGIDAQRTPAADNAELFKTWQARIPTDAADVLVDGKPTGMTKEGDAYVVELAWKNPVRDVQWFAPAYDDAEISEAVVAHDGAASKVTFKVRPFDQNKPIDFKSLVATVAYVGQDNVRRGVTVPLAPLADAQ